MIKNLSILISKRLFLGLVFLREAKQGISCNISFSLTIIDFEVVSRKFLCLVDLRKTRTFCIHESAKIIIINENEELVFVVLQVVVPNLKSFNNNQKLLIVGFVTCLGWIHLFQEKKYRVPLAKL